MSILLEQTSAERRAIEAIRGELRTRLESGALSTEQVAERLDLVPRGVRNLLLRSWSFEQAYRVATALDFDFVRALNGNSGGEPH